MLPVYPLDSGQIFRALVCGSCAQFDGGYIIGLKPEAWRLLSRVDLATIIWMRLFTSPYFISASISSSPITFTPSSRALSSFEPASAPATT